MIKISTFGELLAPSNAHLDLITFHLLEGNRPEALNKLTSVHVARQLTRHDRSLLNFDLFLAGPLHVQCQTEKQPLANHSRYFMKPFFLIGSLAYILFGSEQEEGK